MCAHRPGRRPRAGHAGGSTPNPRQLPRRARFSGRQRAHCAPTQPRLKSHAPCSQPPLNTPPFTSNPAPPSPRAPHPPPPPIAPTLRPGSPRAMSHNSTLSPPNTHTPTHTRTQPLASHTRQPRTAPPPLHLLYLYNPIMHSHIPRTPALPPTQLRRHCARYHEITVPTTPRPQEHARIHRPPPLPTPHAPPSRAQFRPCPPPRQPADGPRAGALMASGARRVRRGACAAHLGRCAAHLGRWWCGWAGRALAEMCVTAARGTCGVGAVAVS